MHRGLLLLLTVVAAGCGGSSSTDTGTTLSFVTNGTFSATVNGAAWGALGQVIVKKPTSTSLAMSAGSTTYAMTFTLLNVTGPGTTSLVSSPANGSHVLIGATGGGWDTSVTGGTGSVTITSLTANHVIGTFAFDAPAVGGGSPLHVTAGVFDLTF